jgi:hypothetical protein
MNDDERFEAILIECLSAMESGVQAERLLARYPAYAAQLDAALRVAVRLRALELGGPSPVVQKQARTTFLARAATMRPVSRRASSARWLLRPLVSFVTVLALAVVGSGVLVASAASLPGDPLYSIKRSFENLQLSLARDPLQRANLEESYTRRRAEEVKAVQASKRATSVQFTAPVETMDNGVWVVGGFTVQVLPGTAVHGAPRVGELVEVVGRTLSDGQIVADRIEVESVEFVGVVEAMGAPMWNIGGQRVLVTAQTQIVGAARLGAQVEVHVRMLADGALLALKVDFQDAPATPQPTAAPAPRPTSTLRPTQPPKLATPQPAVTHEREGDATPESRPTDGHGDHGTPEPKSTEDHGGKDTPEPESTEDHGSSDPGSPKPDSAGDSVRH